MEQSTSPFRRIAFERIALTGVSRSVVAISCDPVCTGCPIPDCWSVTTLIKVPRQTSSQSLVVSPCDLVVSRADLESENHVRHSKSTQERSKHLSWVQWGVPDSRYAQKSPDHWFHIWRGGGARVSFGPPSCEDVCLGTLKPWLSYLPISGENYLKKSKCISW